MRCCSAGKSGSQIWSSRVIPTVAYASSRSGSRSTARLTTSATHPRARRMSRSCSTTTTAASSPAAGGTQDDEGPACSLFSLAGRSWR